MEKLSALWNLFRKGEAVDNPVAWKNGGVSVAALAAVFVALARVAESFGHPLPIDEKTADGLAAGVLAVVHIVLTYTTSDKVGILPAKPAALPNDDPAPAARITEADVQAGRDFADKANAGTGRGQNIE